MRWALRGAWLMAGASLVLMILNLVVAPAVCLPGHTLVSFESGRVVIAHRRVEGYPFDINELLLVLPRAGRVAEAWFVERPQGSPLRVFSMPGYAVEIWPSGRAHRISMWVPLVAALGVLAALGYRGVPVLALAIPSRKSVARSARTSAVVFALGLPILAAISFRRVVGMSFMHGRGPGRADTEFDLHVASGLLSFQGYAYDVTSDRGWEVALNYYDNRYSYPWKWSDGIWVAESPLLGMSVGSWRFSCALTYPIVLVGAVALFSIRYGRRFQGAGHCVQCGYDLRATPERCPECGREANKASNGISRAEGR